MKQHRVRLSDEDLAVITAALRARRAMVSDKRLAYFDRLIERLEEGRPGNPAWRLGWESEEETT